MMTLKDYIASLGTPEFARRHGISPRTAEAYRQGRRRPRPEAARQIIARSRGRLTWAGVYPSHGQ
jgi:hypothetical protein